MTNTIRQEHHTSVAVEDVQQTKPMESSIQKPLQLSETARGIFEKMFHKLYAPLCAYAVRNLHVPYDNVESVIQEAFLEAMAYEAKHGELEQAVDRDGRNETEEEKRKIMFRRVFQESTNDYRKRTSGSRREDLGMSLDWYHDEYGFDIGQEDTELEQLMIRVTLDTLLQDLPDTKRQLLLLQAEGMSIDELSAAFDMKPGTVKSLVKRTKDYLKEMVDMQDDTSA